MVCIAAEADAEVLEVEVAAAIGSVVAPIAASTAAPATAGELAVVITTVGVVLTPPPPQPAKPAAKNVKVNARIQKALKEDSLNFILFSLV